MRALVQRVTEARCLVDGEVVGEIGEGLCVLVGVTHDDTEVSASRLAAKVANLRVFDDADGIMNHSLLETGGAALVVSQFTLYGDTERRPAPGWSAAAAPEVAEPLSRRSRRRWPSWACRSRPAASAPTCRSRWSTTAR